ESKYKSSEKAPFPPRKPADQLRIDIVNGQYGNVKKALESKDPTFIKQIVNDRAENGDTPLAVAIRYNNQEIMGLLLAHEANSDSDTNGALDWASDDLRKMLNNQTSIGLLHFGIGQDNIKYLKELLKKHDIDPKIVVNGTDSKGKTPLGFAVEKNNREIVKLLLEYDADPDSIVNQTDLPRKTPLILAVEKNSSEIVKLLLEYGADPDSITCPPETNSAIRDMIYIKTQANLLRSSITFGNDYNAIENILSGVKTSTMKNFLPKIVNDRDKNGKTPLVLAVEKNSSEIVKLLLEYGANPDSVKLYPPETNSAIIDMISIKSTANLLRSYITFGDDDGTKKSILRYKKEGLLPKIINDQDENGKTLLVLAVEKNSSEIVKLLLGNGADPYSIVNGTTLLDLAIKHGNKEIITLIKTYFTYY
ncbi:MAG: ankyrin repeat domain-containing protein, partial [Holosporaceae bacterium]|nr:ankyrin repeat domain-containing protein [Holosporaceae bacterium]